MSSAMLTRLQEFIFNHSDPEGFLPWVDPRNPSEPLHREHINLYNVNRLIVKPATARHQCSLAELMTDRVSCVPTWFISHWWGEPVYDFIRAVLLHTQTRHLTEMYYWVLSLIHI
eukprot:TRINITY_DN32834_c0_g1_i2.p1 TRINITY_DN32834_c0_g1~~TRINITY_DN32834_c0_g1_i2.p1  ORF type:complete len:115 (-),score=10.88 TRINITY_DN32834_c0_g1_i2:89-433(-)